MKKLLVSALAALAMVIGGFVPAANAAPANPTNFVVLPGSNPGEVTVSWDVVSGETYRIGYFIQGGGSGIYGNLVSTTSSPYTFTGLSGGTADTPTMYQFAIYAELPDTTRSGWVDHFAGVQPTLAVGTASSISSGSSMTVGSLYVSWNAATNATGYNVYYGATSTGPWTSAGTANYSSKEITGLDPASTYFVKIEPTRSGNSYPATVSSTAFTPYAGLTAPSGLTVTTPQSGRLAISWSSVAGSQGYAIYTGPSQTGPWTSVASSYATAYTLSGLSATTPLWVKVASRDNMMNAAGATISSASVTPNGGLQVNNNQVVVVTPVVPAVPVFKQPKFAMPSKIDVDLTGKVSLSGKDMGVSTVLIGGKEQKIDVNSDEALVFDTTGLAKGVHDLVMKGAFGTYTIQKAIQVGEAVVTKVAAVSARQVGMAGGELSISGVGLEGTTQITMNGQVLEILSKTDGKVTFKVPASTVASVNSIMVEGSFVPVLFKNAFSYTK